MNDQVTLPDGRVVDSTHPLAYGISPGGTLHRVGKCYGARRPYNDLCVRNTCRTCLPHGAIVRYGNYADTFNPDREDQ